MTDKQSLILAEDKETLTTLGHSVKTLLPGSQNLTDNQAISVANYAALAKANPFRGEVYGFVDFRGQLKLVDGYKLLVRWAKKISDYDETYSDRLPVGTEGLEDGDIGYRITLLRHDKKSTLREYIQLGATFREAYDLVSNSAVGIVKRTETWSKKKNKAIDPPTGWSWDQVARKRALKNVLNLAYAMPSIEELIKDSWQVGGIDTLPEDWPEEGTYKTTAENEAHARLTAQERQRQEKVGAMNEMEKEAYSDEIETATEIMSRNGDDDPIDGQDDLPEKMHPSARFWRYANSLKMERSEAGKFYSQAGGDFDKALELLKEAQAQS